MLDKETGPNRDNEPSTQSDLSGASLPDLNNVRERGLDSTAGEGTFPFDKMSFLKRILMSLGKKSKFTMVNEDATWDPGTARQRFLNALTFFSGYKAVVSDVSTGKTRVIYKDGREESFKITFVNLIRPVGAYSRDMFTTPADEYIPADKILNWRQVERLIKDGCSIQIYKTQEDRFEVQGGDQQTAAALEKLKQSLAELKKDLVIQTVEEKVIESVQDTAFFSVYQAGQEVLYKAIADLSSKRDRESVEGEKTIVTGKREGVLIGADHNGRGGELGTQYQYSTKTLTTPIPLIFRGTLVKSLSSEEGYLRLDPPLTLDQIASYCFDKNIRFDQFEESLLSDLKAVAEDLLKAVNKNKPVILHDQLIELLRRAGISVFRGATLGQVLSAFKGMEPGTGLVEKRRQEIVPNNAASRKITLVPELGIHGRLAVKIIEKAEEFADTEVFILKDGQKASCQSISELMMLDAPCGTKLTAYATGKRRDEALLAVVKILEEKKEKQK